MLKVNNAGITVRGPFYESSMEVEQDGRSKCECRLNLSRAVLPRMIDRRKGAIINISSLVAVTSAGSLYIPQPNML